MYPRAGVCPTGRADPLFLFGCPCLAGNKKRDWRVGVIFVYHIVYDSHSDCIKAVYSVRGAGAGPGAVDRIRRS